jgi:renalase
MQHIAIIGAGIAGAVAAHVLAERGYSVQVLEKSRGAGGRMATRRGQLTGQAWDHGAQYFTVESPSFQTLTQVWAQQGWIQPWFEQLQDTQGNALGAPKTRWKVTGGMNKLAKNLLQHPKITLTPQALVAQLSHSHGQWMIQTEAAGAFHADALILTAPVPQALALFANSPQLQLDSIEKKALEAITYDPSWALLIQLDPRVASTLPEPGGFKGRMPQHPLAWVADNALKGSSSHPGTLTVHASAEFSREHFEADPHEVETELLAALAEQLGVEELPVDRVTSHRWRYSLVRQAYPEPTLTLTGDHPPCCLAGDAFGGGGKIETAVLSGLTVANQWAKVSVT